MSQQLQEYRIRQADNKIQFYVEQDINFMMSSKPERAEACIWNIIDVKYSKTKATKSMYRLIEQHKNHKTTIL